MPLPSCSSPAARRLAVLVLILPGCFPSLLCHAQPRHRDSRIPALFSTSFSPRGGRRTSGHGAVPCKAHSPGVSISCCPLCPSRFLPPTRHFLRVWQLHRSGLSLGASNGTPEPPRRGALSGGCRHRVWGAFGTHVL